MKTPTSFNSCLRLNRIWMWAVLFLMVGECAQAQFTFVTNNGAITITKYTGSGGAVAVPSIIEGLPVTGLGDYAFAECRSLTSITIPDGVTNIGTYGFQNCSSLSRVSIGDGLTQIGFGAFFACTSLTNVTIPNTVIDFATYAFRGCSSLALVTIPNTVTSIGNGAFFGCSSLINIAIPSSVRTIGSSAFYGCDKLEGITVDAANPAYSSLDGVLFNKNATTLIQCPGGKTGTYTVPGSVTVIGDGGFYYCRKLTGVALPNSLVSIRDQAFISCVSLTSATIPDKVTSLGSGSFSYCSGLTNVTIGKGVASIGGRAFTSCSSLTAIVVDPLNPAYKSHEGVLLNKDQTLLIQCPAGKSGSYSIPTSVRDIGSYAFSSCIKLASVTIPNGVTSIESYAFSFCTNLTSVMIPMNVTFLGDRAFVACSALAAVYFSGNAPWLESLSAFYNANIATVYYLPGTKGWGTTFGGRPAVLWNPVIEKQAASFGILTNQFGFSITGNSGLVIVVEACTNLASPTWLAVSTNTLKEGSSYFSDSDWHKYSQRVYRLRSP